jgi:FkbH-like protein
MTEITGQPATLDSIKVAIRQREQEAALCGADYRRFSRQLRELSGEHAIKLAVLGNVTSDLLVPFLAVNAAREGIPLRCYTGNFAQHFQDLKDKAFAAFNADMVFLLLSLELLRPDAMAAFGSLDSASRRSLGQEVSAEIGQWVALAERDTRATIVLANFSLPTFAALGIADAVTEYTEADFYNDLNRSLSLLAKEHPRVHIFDLASTSARVGTNVGEDRRLFFIAKVGWTERLMAEIGRDFVRHLIAATGRAKKCLVLDLDNTLWGGVIGEDGPWGIRASQGDPEGEAFRAFQSRIRVLKQRGVLLALCSKNTPAEVEALFVERTDMPLAFDDFAAKAIGWGTKDQGLIAVADQLNIGLDSLVFIDDNPAEVALIRSRLPMVETVQLPPEPALFVNVLDRLPYFEKSRLTAEDANKAGHYAAEAERQAARADVQDEFEYLRTLGMQLELRTAKAHDLTRIHQLFSKTNQFNTTTRRYSHGELEQFLVNPAFRLEVASLRDKFGDLGMVACILVDCSDDRRWRMDSFLMSCRAMGRGVETVMINRLKLDLLEAQRKAPTQLIGEFITTARNQPASKLLEEQGFKPHGVDPGGIMLFQIDGATASLHGCDWIEIVGETHE